MRDTSVAGTANPPTYPPVLPRRHHILLARRAVSLPEPLACRQAGGLGLAGAAGFFIALVD